jgi:O-antigen ligase
MATVVEATGIGVLALSLWGALIVSAVRAWRHGELAIKAELSPLTVPLLAVTISLLVGHAYSIDRRYSAWRICCWVGYLAVLYLAALAPKGLISWAAVIVGVPVAAATVIEAVGWAGRPRLLGNPNITAAWLLTLLYLADGALWNICSIFGIIATGSRGALLGVFSAFLAKARVSLPILILSAFLALALVATRTSTVQNRLRTWREALGLFLERPIVGWGPGTYELLSVNENRHPHADNAVLTIAAEQGVIGLVGFLWLAVAVARLAAGSSSTARWGLMAWGVHNLVDFTLWWYWVGIVLMCLIAVVKGDE